MHAKIYVRAASEDQPLEGFARRLFTRLHVAHFEKRESSNYVEGHYFRATAVGIEVIIARADTRGLEDYRFCLTLTAEQSVGFDSTYLQEHAHTLARQLSKHGWRCFVPDDVSTVAGKEEGRVYEG